MATRIEPQNGILYVKAAAASGANLTLSGAQTVDGVSCSAGDVVLAWQQSTGAEKAPYLVQAGAWILVDPGMSDGLEFKVLQGSTLGEHTIRVTNAITWGSGTPTFEDQTGGTSSGGMVTLTGTQELTNKTLTAMVVKTGLTASGSASNNFSGSTGAFVTSTGANTLSGDVSLAAGKDFVYAAGAGEFDGSLGTGFFKFTTGNVDWTGAAGKQFTLTQGVATTGSPYAVKVIGGAHTTLTASAEANDVYFDLSRTAQFATGALTTQRAFLIDAPTYAFVGASTITKAATFAIENAPQAGANATLTNSYAFWVQAGKAQFDGALAATDDVTWTGAAAKSVTLTQGVATTGSPYALKVVAGAHTTLTAGTEANDVYFDLSRTAQFATGAITTQRSFLIDAPTLAFVGASTVTNAGTLVVENAPQAGTNATLTNAYSIWAQAGVVRFDGGAIIAGTVGAGAADAVKYGVADINGAATAAEVKAYEGGATKTERVNAAGILNILEISESVADDGTISLPAPTAGRIGVVEVMTDAEYLKVVVASDASVAAYGGVDFASTNSATTDSDGNLCVFDGGSTVTVKNRLGGAKWILGTYRWS